MESEHDFFLGTSKNNSDLHREQPTSAQLLVLLIVLDTVIVNDFIRLPLGDGSRWLCQAFFFFMPRPFFQISERSWPILALYWSRTPLAALGAVLPGLRITDEEDISVPSIQTHKDAETQSESALWNNLSQLKRQLMKPRHHFHKQ